MPTFEAQTGRKAADLTGTDYSDPAWQELAEQLTPEQAMRLVRLGGYATVQVDGIGLPATQDKDGPSGISGTLVGGQSAMAYPVEVVMASTWNTALTHRLGLSVGNDSIQTGVAVWYAPGVNIHRFPYSGRNFEYFSEDGFLSGQISAAEVRGTREKGVITYMKHFALNDQETNRYGVAVFANEQAIREVFLKGFEHTVTQGNTNAAMASMNRLGATWSGAHKGLMTNVLRDEWGFEGAVITYQASVPTPWEIALTIANIVVFGGCFILTVLTTIRLVKTIKFKPKTEAAQAEEDDIVKKKIVVILTIAALVVGLVGGIAGTKLLGGGSAGTGGSEITGSYIYNEIADNAMGDNGYVSYELTLYGEGTYQMTTSTSSCGYSMLLSNTVTSAYGTYTMGASTDRTTACELSEATRIVYNGYSDIGGYNMSYDTSSLQFPVELLGGVMTEQADFWAMFGHARTVSLDDAITG